jgi:hypothetical protein
MLFLYLLGLALILFALRPRASMQNLRDLFTQRRWVVTTVAILIVIYFVLGMWEVWRGGYLSPWD